MTTTTQMMAEPGSCPVHGHGDGFAIRGHAGVQAGAAWGRIGLARAMLALSGAALLSACAGHAPPMTATQEAATYKARAKPSYAAPGPADDPWGPYIVEAAARFDVPERWIREVMRQESGGHEFRATGELITSPVGAMGLMQLMPETYDEVRARYSLGDDAFDPHNNIMAGTAYVREMYDAFGSPGFLAAYNGGPARLEDYLTHNRPLPTETRRYVAMIGPYIQGIFPQARSPAEQYAVNQLPIDIPAGPRYVRHTNVALASRGRRGHEQVTRYASNSRRGGHVAPTNQYPIEVAEAPEPRGGSRLSGGSHGATRVAYAANASQTRVAYATNASQTRVAYATNASQTRVAYATNASQTRVAYAANASQTRVAYAANASQTRVAYAANASQTRVAYAAPSHHASLHLISSAMASENVGKGVGGHAWAVQVGAYGNASQAADAVGSARGRVGGSKAVSSVHQGHATLYRARLSGMTHEGAVAACHKLAKGRGNCIVVSPAAS